MRIKIGPDVAFILLFVMLIVCIVIPLPGWLLDILISTNICITILILVISLNISSAVELPSFPSILLVTTLFRLSLNVASTRAILTNGDAGRVISAFGNFVISGNYFAGAVVFLIITIIQLLVVTKGAERVAEVSARFTLDAMPGKQMSIDAELRSGQISQEEAIRRRGNLSIESQFFGSMDGAMKFVKGDAIAGILISSINVIGGILTGTIMRDLTISDAIKRYTILSIGDGLVSQIPSLLISISAGIIITRISTIKKSGLGKEIFFNLTRKPLMILIAAIIAMIFSLLPHIPFMPFFLIGIVLTFAYRRLNSSPKLEEQDVESAKTMQKIDKDNSRINIAESVNPFAEPITLVLSERLCQDSSIGSADIVVSDILTNLRKRFFEKLGYKLPGVRVQVSDLSDIYFSLDIFGAEICSYSFTNDPHFVVDNTYSDDVITELENGQYIRLLKDEEKDTDAQIIELKYVVTEILYSHLIRHINELFGIQETSDIIDELSQRYPALVRETIPRTIGINTLSEVLKNLLSERVSVKNMKNILETIERYYVFEKNPNLLSEFVRISLSRQICQNMSLNHRLYLHILSPEINKIIYDSLSEIGGEQVLAISPENARVIIEAVRKSRRTSSMPMTIITDFELRRFVRKVIEYELPFVNVISFKEISPNIQIEVVGNITF